MDAQEIEAQPGYEAVVEHPSGATSTTGIFDYASEAWEELLSQRQHHEDATEHVDYSQHVSRMFAVVGVLDLLESGEPTFRVTWRNLLNAEFGLTTDGTGRMVLPNPADTARTITYQVVSV